MGVTVISEDGRFEWDENKIITTAEINAAQEQLTPERLEELKSRPVVYDEDCPPLTPEQMDKARPKYPERRRLFLEELFSGLTPV